MSTEQKNNQKKYYNTQAYYPMLQDFFEKMVEEGKCSKVSEDKAFGNSRGKTYCFLTGTAKGHWAVLKVSDEDMGTKPTQYIEKDPNTGKTIVFPNPRSKTGWGSIRTIYDAIASINGMENNPGTFKKTYQNAVQMFGAYANNQINTYNEKTTQNAIDEENKKAIVASEKQIAMSQSIREKEISSMICKMIDEIERTGTLFGKKHMDVPILISVKAIKLKNRKRMYDPSLPGQLPHRYELINGGLEKNGLVGESAKKGKNGQYQYKGVILSGLQYVAAMQDGKADTRYMLASEFLPNHSNYVPLNAPYPYGEKNVHTGKIWGPNAMYGHDFGIKQVKDAEGKELSAESLMLRTVYVGNDKDVPKGHEGKPIFTIQKLINIENLVERPYGSPKNYHKEDVSLDVLHPVTKNTDFWKGTVKSIYGKGLKDLQAFEQDPINAMRQVIYEETENNEIYTHGMQAFQRELTLDRMLRRCGYTEGIEIPEKDRAAIISWLKKDLEKRPGKNIGDNFNLSMVAMDRNHAQLMGASREELLQKQQEIERRPKFQNMTVLLQSDDYTMANGQVIPRGAGYDDRWSEYFRRKSDRPHFRLGRSFTGIEAYEFLRDVCFQDKRLFNHQEAPNYHKNVRFMVRFGNEQPYDFSISLGNLDTGNSPSVVESMANVFLKQDRISAYSRDKINENFAMNRKKDADVEWDKLDFVREQRRELQESQAFFDKEWTDFKNDENAYCEKGQSKVLDLSKDADVFRYEVPTNNETLLYEAFDPRNIVRINESSDKPNSLIIEMKRPLEPQKQADAGEEQWNNKPGNITGKPIFFDPTVSRTRATETIEATPYLTPAEKEKDEKFEKSFSLETRYFSADGQVVSANEAKGNFARDSIIYHATHDEQVWKLARNGEMRYEDLQKPAVELVAKWDDEPIFKAKGKYGSKVFSNGQSVEEVLSSQKDQLSDERKAALAQMLQNSTVQQKYSLEHDFEKAMKNNEIVNTKTVAKVLAKDKKLVGLDESISQVDRLEAEAMLNRRSGTAIMDYVVDSMIKEDKVKTPEQMQQVKQEIVDARPEWATVIDKSLKRPEVKKQMAGRGPIR